MNSDLVFKLMIMQTLQVTLLVGIVLILTKLATKDRPHLAHALWALVLLKCLTPPIFSSPTSAFSWLPSGYAAVVSQMRQASTESEQPRSLGQQIEGLAPLAMRLSSEHNPISDTVASTASTATSQTGGRSLVSMAIFTWFAMAACVFAVNAIRLWSFLKRVRQTTLPTSPNLINLVENISKRIGLHRKVRICTVDAAIGPAVVGLIWPTVLLPKAIVEGRADAELEPLLAHELTHIRRGDLVWAMVQGMSVSLWWFNPLVWLAERLLTREAERSCDEETIAGLGCSPAVYARSLLDVMERKHQLRAAPSLPGVRSIDITAKRLERIMRLGHGCYRQRPWWVVGVWVIGCVLVLPGAGWVVAQQKLEQENSAFKESGFKTENLPRPTRAPVAPAGGPVVAPILTESKSFQVGDVVARLCQDRDLSKAKAEKELLEILQSLATASRGFEGKFTVATNDGEINGRAATTDDTIQETELSLEECIANALKNSKVKRFPETIEIVGEQLHASATAEQLNQIERNIGHFRKFGFKIITTEITFYEIPQRLKFDEGILQNLFSRGGDATRYLGVNGRPTTGLNLSVFDKLVVFDEAETTQLREFLEQDKNVACTLSPRITSFSGQLASVESGEIHSVTVAYKAVKTSDGQTDYKPVVEKMHTGLKCEIRAVIAEPVMNGDNQPIELNLKFERSRLKSVHKTRKKLSDTDEELEIELPVRECSSFEIVCPLRPDQSLINVQTYEAKTCIAIVRCRPMDTISAAVPPADLSKIPKTAYVCVSDQLQSELEIASLKHQLQQLGIRDFRLDDGRMKVNVTEDWKAAANAFQALRSTRESTAAFSSKPQR